MRLPAVDRRSPAITTPPSYAAATIVVPWGIASAGVPRGRRSGAAAARKSVNDGEPGVVAYRRTPGADGTRSSLTGPPPASALAQASSLAALLDEGANEILGIRLEDVIDLVEDRIDILGQFLVSLRNVRRGVGLDLVDLVGLPLRAALTTVVGRHRGTPSFVLDLTLTWRHAFGLPVGAREQRRPGCGQANRSGGVRRLRNGLR